MKVNQLSETWEKKTLCVDIFTFCSAISINIDGSLHGTAGLSSRGVRRPLIHTLFTVSVISTSQSHTRSKVGPLSCVVWYRDSFNNMAAQYTVDYITKHNVAGQRVWFYSSLHYDFVFWFFHLKKCLCIIFALYLDSFWNSHIV